MKKPKYVYICSPFRPTSITEPERNEELKGNIRLARDACTLAAYRELIPVALHLYFPQFLSDNNLKEREMSMSMGIELLKHCSQLWLITTRISERMSVEIKEAQRRGIPVLIFARHDFEPYVGNADVTDNGFRDNE